MESELTTHKDNGKFLHLVNSLRPTKTYGDFSETVYLRDSDQLRTSAFLNEAIGSALDKFNPPGNLSLEKRWNLIKANQRLKDSFFAGSEGNNPSHDQMVRYFSFIKGFNPHRKPGSGELASVRMGGYDVLDSKIAESLPFHMKIYEWMPNLYKRRQEGKGFLAYKEVFRKLDPNHWERWFNWMLLEYFNTGLNDYAIRTMLARRYNLSQYTDPGQFIGASGIDKAFYFLGWKDHIRNQLILLRRELFGENGEMENIMKSAIFNEARHRVVALERILTQVMRKDMVAAKEAIKKIAVENMVAKDQLAFKRWVLEKLGLDVDEISYRANMVREQKQLAEGSLRLVAAQKGAETRKRHYEEEFGGNPKKLREEKFQEVSLEVLGYLEDKGYSGFRQVTIYFKPTPRNEEASGRHSITLKGNSIVLHGANVTPIGWTDMWPETIAKVLSEIREGNPDRLWNISKIEVK